MREEDAVAYMSQFDQVSTAPIIAHHHVCVQYRSQHQNVCVTSPTETRV